MIKAGTQSVEALKAQDQGESQRLQRLEQRIAQRRAQECNCRQVLQNQRRQCLALLTGAPVVHRAENRLPLAERVVSLRSAQLGSWRQQAQRLTQCQALERMIQQKLSGIERQAG